MTAEESTARRLLAAYLIEYATTRPSYLVEAATMESGAALLCAARAVRVAVLDAAVEEARKVGLFPADKVPAAAEPDDGSVPIPSDRKLALRALLLVLLAQPLFEDREEALPFLAAVNAAGALLEGWGKQDYSARNYDAAAVFDTALLQLLQFAADQDDGLPELRPLLERLVPTYLTDRADFTEGKRMLARAQAALGSSPPEGPLVKAKPWGAEALADLAKMPPAERERWEALLRFAESNYLEAPSAKRLARLRCYFEDVGAASFEKHVTRWFGLVAAVTGPLMDRNSATLRGLVWCASHADSPKIATALADLGAAGYRKLPRSAARSIVLGDTCVAALGRMPGPAGVAQLTRLRSTTRHAAAQKAIERALADAAGRAGLTLDELEESVLPAFGLDEQARLQISIGGFVAETVVEGTRLGEWRWRTPEGKAQKSVPAAVRKEHADAWQDAKDAAEVLEKVLPGQRDRLERLLLEPRDWPVPVWRARYLDHPLLLGMARRLVWHFESEDGQAWLALWQDAGGAGFIDEHGSGVHAVRLTPGTRVRLWHPMESDVATVQRWRLLLEARQVRQPFKQAHREVYLLTDAERTTATYSNRFAGHLLRHYQFRALCEQRGWSYTLPRFYSTTGDTLASRELPRHGGLRAEFWVEPVWDGETSDTGVPALITTDQVRFRRAGSDAPVPLADIPPLVFSELMRDVDLFVGVTSVAADPSWQDRGDEAGGYWRDQAFGDLSATAQTRAQVLSRLVPRLKIAERCRIEGRFLHVRGDLRTYKIHLGSGNILMEPNDQYLCIVQDRGVSTAKDTENLFLPFDGDPRLSVILSKAFLLAEDTSIIDPTIVSQIRCR